MKKWICLILAFCSLILFGCGQNTQSDSSKTSSQGEISETSGASDVASGQTRFETDECATIPIQMAIEVSQAQFDIDNVEVTLSYGYHFQKENYYTQWKDEERRFLAGAAICGQDFKSLYLEHYPEDDRTVFSLFDKLDVGVYDNRLYLLDKLSYEEKISWEYVYTKNEDGIDYRHSEKVKIPASMFLEDTGYLMFCVWECSLWNEEYINASNIGSEDGCSGSMSQEIFIVYEKQDNIIRFTEYFSSGGAEIIW